jgi:hypothetical protein
MFTPTLITGQTWDPGKSKGTMVGPRPDNHLVCQGYDAGQVRLDEGLERTA